MNINAMGRTLRGAIAVVAGVALLTGCAAGGPPTGSAEQVVSAAAQNPAGGPDVSPSAEQENGPAPSVAETPESPAPTADDTLDESTSHPGDSALPDELSPQTGSVSGKSVLSLLPATFPIPPGAVGLAGRSDVEETVVTINVADLDAAQSYYDSALPSAGYTILVSAPGLIRFEGNGLSESLVATEGSTILIRLNHDATDESTAVSEPPSAGNSKPPATGSDSASVTIRGAGSYHCPAGGSLDIAGIGIEATVTGDCHTVNVSGSNNTVRLDGAAKLVVDGLGNTLTFTTLGDTTLRGSNNTVVVASAKGSLPSLSIEGVGNKVSAAAIGRITLTGSNNHVIDKSGRATVADTGVANAVTQK